VTSSRPTRWWIVGRCKDGPGSESHVTADGILTDLIENGFIHHGLALSGHSAPAQRIRPFHATSTLVVAVFEHVFVLRI